jgi:predicted GH43/DUF377 family glycosyl hydrolase
MLKRYENNPILVPDPKHRYYSKKVYNSAVIFNDGIYHLFFRGVGDDWISRILQATSHDGVNFKILERPVIYPEHSWEEKGCEDPRITYINNRYWLSYTAFDGITARSALASSTNLVNWQKHSLIFPHLTHPRREQLPSEWHKSAAIFPEKCGGKYLLFFGDNHIWSARSDDLINWQTNPTPVLNPRKGFFDSAYIEMGPTPIKTDKGWLILYHGVDKFTQDRTYRLGAALVSIDNPKKVIWRCSKPILEPREDYESTGLVDILPGGFEALSKISNDYIEELAKKHQLPRTVFCCGAMKVNEAIKIYYGACDTRICLATIDLTTIFAS